MNITIDLASGNGNLTICSTDIDKNIEALERYMNGTERVCDFTPMIDTISIFKGIKEILKWEK